VDPALLTTLRQTPKVRHLMHSWSLVAELTCAAGNSKLLIDVIDAVQIPVSSRLSYTVKHRMKHLEGASLNYRY
jgi:hypothetical protein